MNFTLTADSVLSESGALDHAEGLEHAEGLDHAERLDHAEELDNARSGLAVLDNAVVGSGGMILINKKIQNRASTRCIAAQDNKYRNIRSVIIEGECSLGK